MLSTAMNRGLVIDQIDEMMFVDWLLAVLVIGLILVGLLAFVPPLKGD